MVKKFTNWLQRFFANTELWMLLLSIAVIVIIFMVMGKLLAPVLVSIVIAYLLDGLVKKLKAWRFPHILAVSIVCLFFMGALVVALVFILPVVWDQLTMLLNELPNKVKQGQALFTQLSERYPAYISKAQIQNFLTTFQADFGKIGKIILAYTLTGLSSVMTWIVYLILVPLMVFFFLNDRDQILNWSSRFLPNKRRLIGQVWSEVNQQIANYVRAKIIEIVIVSFITTIIFAILGLNYFVLLGVLVGLSALIPYVGVVIVTIPVLIIGYMQWGFTAHFFYLLIIFLVLMILDGNVLAPLLFSETLKIHPLAVIIAILIFGGLWGFWGVFFAIPLATVVKAVLNAWFHNGPASDNTS